MTRRKPSRIFWRDVAERMVATFAQGALGAVTVESLAAAFGGASPSVLRAAAIGGVSALLALAKGWAARRVGDPESASLLND